MSSPEISTGTAESPELSAAAKQLLPWLVAVALFMESLDTTILNTAVPAVSEALKVTPLAMKAVLASYTLALAVFIPISGWMADRFGTRRVFASAIGLFTLGSLLCGLCSNIHLLVACRVLQGMGGAMMVPVGRLTLVRAFPKHDLLRVMTFIALPAQVAPMLGPMAGGLIVAYFHWRVIFFLNVPIGLLGLVLVYMHLPDYREEKTHPLDFVGLVLFGSGIALLSYVLEVFGEHELSSREIAGLLGLSVLLMVAYWMHGRKLEFPLLNLSLFNIRTFRAAVSGGFFTRLGIGGVPFLLPLLYQTGLGFTPIQSGLLIMPQAIASMGMKAILRKVLGARGYKTVLVVNTLLVGVLLALFAVIGLHTPVWVIILIAVLYGGCTSLQYSAMNTLVFADVEEKDTSMASSVASTGQQLSISFGVAAAGLTTAFFVPGSAYTNPGLMVGGIHKAFLWLGVMTVASTLVFTGLKRTDGESVNEQKEHETHVG
ncbi:DHA2 family efflux MFS transporter permease subunit [Terracidiphilus sp.]|jgi:EmrB/QacA subfamily drug resistance transporter|uniref:DHA2 family efflux MFS transporter permease subunit n=1 Tax=Terracidiphilus sp. TaxID=1964191 RepID=UPI003C17265E